MAAVEPSGAATTALTLSWTAADDDRAARVAYLRREGALRGLGGGVGLGLFLPLALVVSVAGWPEPWMLAVALAPGAVLVPLWVAYQVWWVPGRAVSGHTAHVLCLTRDGLAYRVGGDLRELPWRALERVVVGAGHVHLHIAGDVWHVPRHAIADHDELVARIAGWRHRRDRTTPPPAPTRVVWRVRGRVAPTDWVRHARGRGGVLAGVGARLALWRDPDLWPCGALEVALAPHGGWVEDGAGVRRFPWTDVVAVVRGGGGTSIRFRDAPPVLLCDRDLPSPDVVHDVQAWTAAPPPPRAIAQPDPANPYAPPG